MPELPEVETSRRGIAPYLEGQRVTGVTVRDRRLRWPVQQDFEARLTGATVTTVGRRAKYLLIETDRGTAILHLGMSGHVYIVDSGTPAGIHDHLDIELESGKALRLRDPRRFGSAHFSVAPWEHPLLAALGPEPLGPDFNGLHLWSRSRGRRVAVKSFIMTAGVVVGVGNIYASEALFLAGIHPKRAAGRIARLRYERLADGTGKSDPGGRHDLAGFLRRQRRSRVFQTRTGRLRPRWPALCQLPTSHCRCRHRPALELLLPTLPDLTKKGGQSTFFPRPAGPENAFAAKMYSDPFFS
jgi:formamidopyrimidine-DNA glycosylase